MMKPPLGTTIASLLGVAVITPTSLLTTAMAGETGGVRRSVSVETAVERETARRRDYLVRGEAAMEAGEIALREKDYEKAYAQYKLAVDTIPNSPNTGRMYRRALEGFGEAATLLAEQRIAEGRYADAELVLRTLLDDRYNPHHKRARVILANLEDPGFYNKTITPKFRANVEQVKQWFVEARGFYDSGRYDLAFKRCEQILNVDPYNIAARKFQEEVNKKRDDYAISGYNHTRSYMTWQVDKAWDRPVRKFGVERTGVITQDTMQPQLTQRIQRKLERIVIPRLEFREATIREAIEFLKKKSVDLDDPNDPNRGVNIVLKLDTPVAAVSLPEAAAVPVIPGLELPGAGAAPAPIAPLGGGSPDARITVSLQNIPLGEALRYVTGLANLKFKVEQYAVAVVPQGTPTETLITKEWKVMPGLLSTVPSAGGGMDAGGGIGVAQPADASMGGSGLGKRLEAKDFFQASGVAFPPGSSAIYLPSSSKLIVRNTQENLDLIDAIIESTSTMGPVQVEIESKFVEITQNNLKELSFDWLVGQANVPKSGSVFVGGGSSGTAPQLDPSNFPFVAPGGTPVGQFPISSSLRSGNLAISQNAIDALLFGITGSSALAPATAAVSGVFTDPQFQVVVRALNQKKGVDLLSAPRVTAKSGQKATIEIIREFRYPTEFDPPQIPQNFGNQNGGGGGFAIIGGAGGLNPLAQQQQESFPVTPTTPTAFETRNTGVTLEVLPQVGPDNYTIDLELVPQVVEFEGFINYGSPIQTSSTNALGQTVTNVITPNVINQPIFAVRKVTTSVSIFDGQTVVLGGLMREDVQKVEDKIPLLGDIPLLGRLFRSNVDQHLKRNLVIFVSARLINPAGEPVHSEEEKEEVVETLALPEVAVPELPLFGK